MRQANKKAGENEEEDDEEEDESFEDDLINNISGEEDIDDLHSYRNN